MKLFKNSAIGKAAASMIIVIIIASISLQLSISATHVHAAKAVTFSDFSLPNGFSAGGNITNGPGGNLWFIDTDSNNAFHIGRVTPTGTITEFPVPTGADPSDITSGPDGNIWFTALVVGVGSDGSNNDGRIGRMTPAGAITEFSIPTPGSNADSITTGPDGNLWFTESQGNKIGRISPRGIITEFSVPSLGSGPTNIAKGPDGNLWFTENGGNQIGRITPTGTITEFPLRANSYPSDIASGADGNIWFTELANSTLKIGRITPSGVITEFPLPAGSVGTNSITKGPDGNMWFTEIGNKIGYITSTGSITEFTPPNNSGNWDITSGPDGNIWFTGFYSPVIVRVNLSRIPSATSPSWAGYVSQYPAKAPVSSRVTLPVVTCNRVGDLAMWVGYDGWEPDSNTVEQEGVSAHCPSVGGRATFYLWYELYKAKSLNRFPNIHQIPINVPVHLTPGDNVDLFVSIITPDRLAGIPLGRDEIFFSINVYDSSGHRLMKPWTKTVVEPLAFSPRYDSAECIAEALLTAKGVAALPDFGTVTFTNCSVIDDNTALLQVNMSRGDHLLASTSKIARNAKGENSFSVTWVSSS